MVVLGLDGISFIIIMDKKKQIDWRIVCVGIICIAGLEGYALSLGINGVLLTTIIAIIATAIGITIPLEKMVSIK